MASYHRVFCTVIVKNKRSNECTWNVEKTTVGVSWRSAVTEYLCLTNLTTTVHPKIVVSDVLPPVTLDSIIIDLRSMIVDGNQIQTC